MPNVSIHSVCSSRTPQGIAPPTATGWLTVPFVQNWGGSWNVRFSVLKPGKSQAHRISRSSYTTRDSHAARIVRRTAHAPVLSVVTADWPSSEHLGQGWLITGHEEMVRVWENQHFYPLMVGVKIVMTFLGEKPGNMCEKFLKYNVLLWLRNTWVIYAK